MVIVATIAILTAAGCGPEKTPPPEVDGLPVVVAAGDIAACATEGDEATARLVGGIEGTVLTLGDNAYPDGSGENFAECYDPSWGQFKVRTKPSPGNHEYETAGASGYFDYFDYFGDAAGDPDEGYYSYDLGSWHIVALNSNCGEGEIRCGPGSPQVQWLEEDLAANDEEACTLAYFHHPLFTSGEYRPGIERVEHLWEILYAAGVDVVLNGHDHNYQRFAPQDPQGRADPEDGIRQFVVGTGAGASIRSRIRSPTRRSTTTTPTACSNSSCTRRDTSGSSFPWRVKASLTQVLPSATEPLVEGRRGVY
ncbi:MAG TPA: metallophosphoesterase [Rubrobacter sp.]|nr:metallophosphoesterase [Rubrobacter sp.]